MRFGWSRLAYLLITLTLLATLVKLSAVPTGASPGETASSPLSALRESSSFRDGSLEDVSPEALEAVSGVLKGSGNAEADLAGHDGGRAPGAGDHTAEKEAGEDPLDHDHAASGPGDHAHEAAQTSLYRDVDFRVEAPVFYRPAVEGRVGSRTDGTRRSSGGRGGAKVCENVNAAPPGAKIIFPMTSEFFDSYEDTWGAARPQGGHEGTDLMAPDGAPEFAMTDGTVVPVSGSNANGWNTLGGYTVMIRADYSIGPVEEGDLFYYAHLNQPTKLRPGDAVRAGDVVGYAGDTGEGPEGTRGGFPSHLHLGWYDLGGDRSQVASGAMNPYPLLEWIKANGGSIKGGENVPYCVAEQPATPTPSTGGSWPFPANPGVRPDMDTGSGSPAPTPSAAPRPSAESSPTLTPDRHDGSRPGTGGGAEGPANNTGNGNTGNGNGGGNATAGEEPVATPGQDAGETTGVGAGAAISPGSPQPPAGGLSGEASGGAPTGDATGEATGDAPAGVSLPVEAPGELTEGGPATGPDRAKLPKGFWSLSRAERIHHLLRLERLGFDLPARLERWLEAALGADEPGRDRPANGAPSSPGEGPAGETPDSGDKDGAEESGAPGAHCESGDAGALKNGAPPEQGCNGEPESAGGTSGDTEEDSSPRDDEPDSAAEGQYRSADDEQYGDEKPDNPGAAPDESGSNGSP